MLLVRQQVTLLDHRGNVRRQRPERIRLTQQQHPRHTRVARQIGHPPSQLGDPTIRIDRTQ